MNWSDRRFQVWGYTVSHGQLLLRSNKDRHEATRVDLLFKNVTIMKLPSYFKGLTVSESTVEAIGLGDHQAEWTLNQKVYRLRAQGFEGYVVAGFMDVHEDDKEYYEPGAFFEDGPGLAVP